MYLGNHEPLLRVPDLAVRVRVGATHDGALVLEDLHPAVPLAQLPGLLRPPLHHRLHLGGAHERHRHVRLGVEAHHAARPRDWFRPEELVLDCVGVLFVLVYTLTQTDKIMKLIVIKNTIVLGVLLVMIAAMLCRISGGESSVLTRRHIRA